MTKSQRRLKQAPSVFTYAVMVGAVGLSLAGSSPGGMNAPTGFFLAFAVAFLAGTAALLYGRRRHVNDTSGSEPPGEDPQPAPIKPIAPAGLGGVIKQGRSRGQARPDPPDGEPPPQR
jgi:hypothetical protein